MKNNIKKRMIPAAQMKMKKVFEDVHNLSKRLKEVLSPGNQFQIVKEIEFINK